MCPKIEKRQKDDSDEIAETGEQKLMEMLEIKGTYYPIQVIDEEDEASVSSFGLPNEGICHFISALEEIDDDSATAIAEAKSEADLVCGLGGVSEKEIQIPTDTEVDSLLSATDEMIEPSAKELEDLAKVFD